MPDVWEELEEATRELRAAIAQNGSERPPRPALRLIAGGEEPTQKCRDCGEPFPYDPDADRCPPCVAAALGEDDDDAC